MSIYAPLVGNLWLTLESYGVDPCEVIDEKIYRPGRSTAGDDRIRFEDYDAILSRTALYVSDPAVGLRAAEFIHPSHLGALGYAWLASTTLRAAIRRAERYSRMYNERLVMRVEELPERVSVAYRLLTSHARPHDVGDANPAVLLKLCRINLGRRLEPLEVELQRPEPADPSPWLEFFGPNVRFGGRSNRLSISARDADTPLTGANEQLVAVNEEMIRRYLLKLDRHSILNRARLGIIEHLPSGPITEEKLARTLNTSKRTLHRKLRENGETFRSLVKQVRMELAEHYVGSDDHSITEIAFLLGFSDTSAFSRAFRDWFGCSPTEKRREDAEKRGKTQ